VTEREPPKIVFLDQNHWIDLAHAFDNPSNNLALHSFGLKLREAVIAGKMLFPLTSNLIVETYRMGNDDKRAKLAETQAKFSQGYVFRDRRIRLRHELAQFVRKSEDLPVMTFPKLWFLSRNFVESFIDWSQAKSDFGIEADQLEGIKADPKYALYHWLATVPEEERRLAMENYSAGSDKLVCRIMARVNRLRGETFQVRRKIYAAIMMVDESDRIFAAAHSNGILWQSASDIGDSRLRRMMRDVPTYHAEVELAARIESMNRPIQVNDLRDMEAYVTTLPYADAIVGENLFVNMAKQAKLDKRFGCTISTKILELDQFC
jgi:hypothetical protein